MTTLSLSDTRLAPARPAHAPSIWRGWLDAIAARRRRQADRVILRSLHSGRARCDADFRIELERRLLGQ